MSRGRPSEKALAAALPVARVRGEVLLLRQYPGTSCDFIINGPGGTVAVSIRRTRRLHEPPAGITGRFREPLARIAAAGHSPGTAREFWLWCPYGSLRFFRVDGTTLTEIDRLGVPIVPGGTGTCAGVDKEKRPKHPPAGKRRYPENLSDTGDGKKPPDPVPVSPARAKTGEREPAPVRYLKRRAAEKRPAKPAGPGTGTPPGEVVNSPS